MQSGTNRREQIANISSFPGVGKVQSVIIDLMLTDTFTCAWLVCDTMLYSGKAINPGRDVITSELSYEVDEMHSRVSSLYTSQQNEQSGCGMNEQGNSYRLLGLSC